jgi:Concanavalin A-like lectin/glucanases superfamily
VLSFSGSTGDSVSMSSISGLTSTAATFECWMKMSTAAGVAGNTQALVTLDNELNNGLNSPQLAYSHYDTLMVTWGGDTYYSADTRPVSDGARHHVAVVFDHGYVMIYKDGVVTADSFRFADALPAETTLRIGTGAFNLAAFDGELYDVRVWNTARTASEISSFRYATLRGNEPGLVALWNPDYFDPLISLWSVINQVTHNPGQMSGQAQVVLSRRRRSRSCRRPCGLMSLPGRRRSGRC